MSDDEQRNMDDRLAVWCSFLRRTIQSGRLDGPVVTLCSHPVRDGFDCVGPFMEDMPTSCGLWERSPSAPRVPRGEPA